MPANILSAIITADSKGFVAGTTAAERSVNRLTKAIDNDTLSLKDQEAILKRLKLQLASLSKVQLKSSIGKELKADIGIAQNEIAKLKIANDAAGSSFGAISKGASGAFGVLRQAAFILPGIGIAGILGGVIDLVGGLFKTGEAASKADKEMQKLLVSVGSIKSEAGASTAGEAAQVNSLVGIVTNLNKSYAERNRALNELKGINKNYFGDLSLEASSLALLKTRADEYTKAIIQQAVIKKFSDKIADVAVALSEQTAKVAGASAAVKKYQRDLQGAEKATPKFGGLAAQANTDELNKFVDKVDDANDVLTEESKIFNTLVGKSKDYRKALTEAIVESLKFKPLDGDKVAHEADKSIAAAKRLADFLNRNTMFEVHFEVDETKSEAENIRAAKNFIQRAKNFVENATPEFLFKPVVLTDFKFKPVENFLKNATDQILPESTRSFAEVRKAFEENINRLAGHHPVVIQMKAQIKPFSDLQARIQEQAKSVVGVVNEQFTGIFAAIGQSIGEGLAGRDMFAPIIDFLAAGLAEVGKALIKYGVIKTGIDNLLKGGFNLPGGIAIGLGVAAIAFAALIKNSKSALGGFRALGGPVQAGQSYIVGERGPELFRPNNSGRIVPNHSLKSGTGASFGSGAAAVVLSGDFTIHRNDLVLFIQQAIASQGRLT
jgi:hypothetical protein